MSYRKILQPGTKTKQNKQTHRDGAPFYPRFSELVNYLEDSGLRGYWTEEVLQKRIRESRNSALLYVSGDSVCLLLSQV